MSDISPTFKKNVRRKIEHITAPKKMLIEPAKASLHLRLRIELMPPVIAKIKIVRGTAVAINASKGERPPMPMPKSRKNHINKAPGAPIIQQAISIAPATVGFQVFFIWGFSMSTFSTILCCKSGYSNSFLDSAVKIMAATPSWDEPKKAAMEPARASFHIFLFSA